MTVEFEEFARQGNKTAENLLKYEKAKKEKKKEKKEIKWILKLQYWPVTVSAPKYPP